MQLSNKITIILLGVLIICTGILLYRSSQVPSIAYVRSGELIYNYTGMKEMQQAFQVKQTQWQSNIDTLKVDFQRSVSQYNKEYNGLTQAERKERENMLTIQQNSLVQYQQSISQQSKQEEDKMTQGVLNQVNSFVQEYAENHGYDLVLGTTLSGNILYAENMLDITDEVLAALNTSYKRTDN